MTSVELDLPLLINKKIMFFKEICQKTLMHINMLKNVNIVNFQESLTYMNMLTTILTSINDIISRDKKDGGVGEVGSTINSLQSINNDISSSFKIHGTQSFDDLLWICFGNNSINIRLLSPDEKHEFDMLIKHFHPICYVVVSPKETKKPTKVFEIENYSNSPSFYINVHGIRVTVYNQKTNKTIIVDGILDNIDIDFINNSYISSKMTTLRNKPPVQNKTTLYNNFLYTLMFKDILRLGSVGIYSKFTEYINSIAIENKKNSEQITKTFLNSSLYSKRNMLINLLINPQDHENQYMAYLLYDIISSDSPFKMDMYEQNMLIDSFPLYIRTHFKESLRSSIDQTTNITLFDLKKIPFEQQICLMAAPDSVKDRAAQKLREIKSKGDDSSSGKAKQYLEGLLRIPFGNIVKEEILQSTSKIKNIYTQINGDPNDATQTETNVDIYQFIRKYKESHNFASFIIPTLGMLSKIELCSIIGKINELIIECPLDTDKLSTGSKKPMIQDIIIFVNTFSKDIFVMFSLYDKLPQSPAKNIQSTEEICMGIKKMESNYVFINNYMKTTMNTMNSAIYGHSHAKKQLSRIIGQWINGEQSGHCFGFEGPPGVGKTSLAMHGIAKCLVDEDGNGRPFSMIQLGGDSNGSSLVGHNYTYVGSTWGSIIQILMDKKCMNPIIFIDEVDKISKTENGKEISGILTHILDATQNMHFQDKYFSGIDIDLSKVLFILSYNDPISVDSILLDRIHRIKFDSLLLDDKIIICKNHILPEIYKKMGLENAIYFPENTLSFIIQEYTYEAGVRKLHNVLYEIIGDINLKLLNNIEDNIELPITLTISDIKTTYLKHKHPFKNIKICTDDNVGIINGLWANAMGQGGVIQIQTAFFPSREFLSLRLTGMQGDVMQESMNVALSLAWKLTSDENKALITEKYAKHQNGIHIHCPEGSVPKDGPSAGTAITCCLYSLLNEMPIKKNIAITGEITLDGTITEIGGLELKIWGGIKAGISEFYFPEENVHDFNLFMEKHDLNPLLEGITFTPVTKIQNVLTTIFSPKPTIASVFHLSPTTKH